MGMNFYEGVEVVFGTLPASSEVCGVFSDLGYCILLLSSCVGKRAIKFKYYTEEIIQELQLQLNWCVWL